ncbi:MAG: hypothetical protein P1V34_01915 [Alphaproteobacteria bacterium]|nr:hypothetical protein [Alphaproteobacteria bacterium]
MSFLDAAMMQPLWVQIWLMWLVPVLVLAPLALLLSKNTRRAGLATIAAHIPLFIIVPQMYDTMAVGSAAFDILDTTGDLSGSARATGHTNTYPIPPNSLYSDRNSGDLPSLRCTRCGAVSIRRNRTTSLI